jgi:hypothetical protein
MVATIFISICGGRKERPCSLPRSDSERTGRDREDGQKAGAFHGASIRGTSHDRRNCAYCPGVFDLEDGDDAGHTLPHVSRGCHRIQGWFDVYFQPALERNLRRVLIFAAIVATFLYGMIAAMLGTILPDLSDRFQLTPRQNGIIAFAQALGLIIASLATND